MADAAPSRVSFSRSLYHAEAVQAAAAAYASLAEVRVEEAANEVTAVLDTDDPDLVGAFCNHVLHATVNLRRAQRAEAS